MVSLAESSNFSSFSNIVARRTYARKDNGYLENWDQTVERAIMGNVRGHNVPDKEIQDLLYFGKTRKAGPAGRGWWFSGAPAHAKIGGCALVNCWAVEASDWMNFVLAQDLLMLGGGVGVSVEHRFVSKLPKIRKNDIVIEHKGTKDADFIVPDSREGWCELFRRTLESYFVTGKSFTYSTVCVRGYGEPIKGFGGTSSGPLPLIEFISTVCEILKLRSGKHLRPIDAADLVTSTGRMVVSGNVRRSAILIVGDAWDKELLKAKRWDLGTLPAHRSCANYSVTCSDTEDLHPLFWKTFEVGEAFGLCNRWTTQRYGRMGELLPDTAYLWNPCVEATLENGEPCNLQEIGLPNIKDEAEFIRAARLMHRYGKRVTMERYHHPVIQEVIDRNRRVGTGITGCLSSPLFNPKTLDAAYAAIQEENVSYSKELGIPKSIRTTVVKPSGTWSKVADMHGYEGIHAALSEYLTQRMRVASNDPLVPILKAAGHFMEPVKNLDGTLDHRTLVVDFYEKAPNGFPIVDQGFDTWKQLDVLKMAQKHWADQAVSVSIYYKREEIPKIKEWLAQNIDEIKSISFLAYEEHGYVQAPKEAITKEQYEVVVAKLKPIQIDQIPEGDLDSQECAGGACPVK